MAGYGDTFIYNDNDDEIGHLHVIVTEPDASDKVITISVTTRHQKSDALVPLEVGDHPYITRRSVFTFAYAKVRTIAGIDAVIASGDASQREPMDEKFLRRCRSGLIESDFTPYEVVEFYKSLARYANDR
jgi:hypothetical protein